MDTLLGQLLVLLVTLHLLLYGVGMVIGGNDLGSRLNKKLWNFWMKWTKKFIWKILLLIGRCIHLIVRGAKYQLIQSFRRIRNGP